MSQLHDITNEAREAAAETLAAFDVVFDQCDAIRAAHPDDPGVQAALTKIYGLGSVQDVVRQRMEKIARLAARIIDPSLPQDDPLLAGPQKNADGISDDEISRLLGDSD